MLGEKMTNYTPSFSHERFFKDGSSLWRWIKYGQSKSVLYRDPFSMESHKSPPVPNIQKRIERLMTKPETLPSKFKERAACFADAAKGFPACAEVGAGYYYPGDGYVFFMDRFFIGSVFPRHTNPVVFDFYNYIYSYRHLMTPILFDYFSNLKNCLSKIRLFHQYRSLLFKDTSVFAKLNVLCKKKCSQEILELLLISRIFRRPLGNLAKELNASLTVLINQLITLLDSYTLKGVKRILFSSQATCKSVTTAINFVIETRSLINNELPHKFDSITSLKKFHDAESLRLLEIEKSKQPDLFIEYTWESKLTDLIFATCEGLWKLPVKPVELVIRGIKHRNCVGSYYGRHFDIPNPNAKKTAHKVIVLFSQEAEAEFQLFFKKKIAENNLSTDKYICSSVKLNQCKTRGNRGYSPEIPVRLLSVFAGCDMNLFVPKPQKTNINIEGGQMGVNAVPE